MSGHCRVALIPALMEALEDTTTRRRLRMMTTATDRELFQEVISTFPLNLRLESEQEYETLPSNFMTVLVTSWRIADAKGIPFVLDSPPPEEPIKAARENRFEMRIAMDDEAIRMDVMHVAGHHPAWMKPAELVAT